jgi:hypothetical protein
LPISDAERRTLVLSGDFSSSITSIIRHHGKIPLDM